MAMSIGAVNIPTTGVYEIDANGNFIPTIVYGVNAPLPGAVGVNAQLGLGTPSYGNPTPVTGGGAGAYAYNGYSSHPFDNVQPASYSAPQYVGNQVLYGHYAPSSAQAMTGAEYAINGGKDAVLGSGASATGDTTPAAAKPAEKPKAEETKKTEEKKPAAKTITVKSGDTLSALGAKHGVSWRELYELNKGVIGGNPNLIRPGQVLKLPA